MVVEKVSLMNGLIGRHDGWHHEPWSFVFRAPGRAGAAWKVAESTPESYPRANLAIGVDECVLTVEVPGIDPADLEVSVHRNIVSLGGIRRREHTEEGEIRRQERRYGQFARSWPLPFAVDEKKVRATLENGILRLVLPRSENDKPKKIDIHHVV
jgi:HSP20 family protein